MRQQADGWREPEVVWSRPEAGLELRSDDAMAKSVKPGKPAEPESFGAAQRVVGRLPWLESTAWSLEPDPDPNFKLDDDHVQLRVQGAESVAALAHDARTMLAALDLYCDLLEAPGVLRAPYKHYAKELRLVAGGSRRLVEKLAALESIECASQRESHRQISAMPCRPDSMPGFRPGLHLAHSAGPTGHASAPEDCGEKSASEAIWKRQSWEGQTCEDQICEGQTWEDQTWEDQLASQSPFWPMPSREESPAPSTHTRQTRQSRPSRPSRHWMLQQAEPIVSLADELMANQNLLSAVAGPGVTLGVSVVGGQRSLAMSRDDFTRVMLNLVKNAVEAMPTGGHIQIALEESTDRLRLSVADSGSGIPQEALDTVFVAGYSTHVGIDSNNQDDLAGWPMPHRGLGLAIVRALVVSAGGSVRVANRFANRTEQLLDLHCGAEQAPCGAVFTLEFPLRS